MREWEWSERYPGQPEIMRYLSHVADRFDLKRDILFNTRVTAAHYDETAHHWQVRTESGESLVAKFLITAVGCLSTANVPKFEGLESFAGAWYHTGQWPHEGVDFTGKRIGMIGTGSTGIRAAPVIAAAAKHLTVFQRTANYSAPARNAPLTPEFQRYIKENPAEIRAVTQETLNGMAFRMALLHGGSRGGTDIYEADALRDADREWLRTIDHAVQCPDGHCDLTLLSSQAASAQRRSD